MRIPLPTDLISRDGTVDQDARLLNCFVEGEEVIKRPATASFVTASGTAQGGIANTLAYMINGDTLRSYNSGGTLVDNIAL